MPARTAISVALLLVPLACDGSTDAEDAVPAPAEALEFDFGVIPHGEVREHTFTLTRPGGLVGCTPLTFRSGCSCGNARFSLQRGEQTLALENLAYDQRTIQPGDRLLLTLAIDTRRAEAVDKTKITTNGAAILDHESHRIELPVVFHYSVHTPVAVRPVAHLDLGSMLRRGTYTRELQLQPDDASTSLGPVETSDARLTAELHPGAEATRLMVTFTPGKDADPGPLQMGIAVHTDRADGYVLRIPVSGIVSPDITVEPQAHISFGRIDLSGPADRFVNVFDHDPDRDPAFVVESIIDASGRSLAEHFDVVLDPVDGDASCTRLTLHYRGSLPPPSFRGVIRLAKPGPSDPRTEITFVGFSKTP
jgi:hypothetical protein